MNVHDLPSGGVSEPKRRRPPRTPKGRQVDPRALDEVRALLGDRSRQRDLLIEHLHLIQDRHGHLSAAHLAALAAEMKLALAEVYEVATFYAHFDVVKEGEAAPPPVTVRVCDSLSCVMAGADLLLRDLPARLGGGVRVMRAPCMGACDRAPVCAVGHVQVMHATADSVAAAASEGAHAHAYPTPTAFEAYRARRRLCLAQDLHRRRAYARRHHQGGERRRPARPRRRRLSDRTQMDAGARRAGAAAVCRQCRRGRARHVQGSLLPRTRSAPVHRGHADRGLDRRGRRHLRLYPRRVPGSPAASARRARQGRAGGPGGAHAAASAPRRRRLYLRRRVRR